MPNLPRAEEDRRLDAYIQSDCDVDAAKMLGLKIKTWRAWRRARNLNRKESGFLVPMHAGVGSIEEKRRLAVYDRAETNREAARELGITVSAWLNWCSRRQLPTDRRGPLPSDKIEEMGPERMKEIYEESETDKQAAAIIGISVDAFRTWRRRQDLPPRGWARGPSDEQVEALQVAWRHHDTYTGIADELGMSDQWVAKQLNKLGYPHPLTRRDNSINGYSKVDLKFWEALCSSLSDLEAANKLGIGKMTMGRWRARNQIPGRNVPREFWSRLRWEAMNGNAVARYYLKKRFPRTHGLPT